MAQITIADLINTLRKAAANPEAHAPAQLKYFSKLKQDSVLVNCGTACCIAGDLLLKAHAGASEQELREIMHYPGSLITPDVWVAEELGLSRIEDTLAFDGNTHYEIHILLADLLEAGLRLSHVAKLSFSYKSTYTSFDRAFFGYYEEPMSLEEVKDWMRSIARKVP